MKKVLLIGLLAALSTYAATPARASDPIFWQCGTPGPGNTSLCPVSNANPLPTTGGGGGGGAVTIINGGSVTLGNTADAAWSGSGSGTNIAILKAIYAGVTGSIPAGTNVIGHVIVDSGGGGAVTGALGSFVDGAIVSIGTEADAIYAGSGSTTVIGALKGIYAAAVQPLAAGTAIIGKVDIDQTTPGTTNGVVLNTGANSVGTVGLNTGTNSIGSVSSIGSQYPTAAVPETISATGTTGATTATLAASGSGQKTYICGFSIRANATAAATGTATVTGVITGTMSFVQWTAPLASGLGINEQVFIPCIPSSATNTAIAVISAAPGSGGTVSVAAWGYLL